MIEAIIIILSIIAQTLAALAGWHVGLRSQRPVAGLWAGALLGLLGVLAVSLLDEPSADIDYSRRDGPGM